ncbi:hypothetical protein J2X20_002287 [Pelomonas saccharophila]|uniref:PEP-CTERM sorting domain-containing protein n=1 Tax=Roseateles saccharophilus TaxID=304 RepID=A0ABU1YLB9_ROSSA|nr:PEP-CTERM sorting domain-containing protein [Roseateles saccharophilus]MDR7269658.1 hypothetical protein [Roseateles saccharophilus]
MTRARHRLPLLLPLLLLAAATPVAAACDRTPLPAASAQSPHRILFVGNSFLHGHMPPVLYYNAARVTDLNGTGYGGVPGVFKQLADDAGLHVEVASELVSGQTLQFHLNDKRALLTSRPWDIVVLQEYSTLSPQRPGDATTFIAAAGRLEAAVHGVNPAARVYLLETWARADQVYRTPGGRWAGRTLEAMQGDLHAAYAQAMARAACIAGVLPVGDAALRAVLEGVADRNPYDGIDAGKSNLWGDDSYHLSAWGSYLEALVIFGRLSGLDPASLGGARAAGRDLGLTAAQIEAAQAVASRQLRTPH